MSKFVDSIDAQLPQTQCQRCGYPNCRAYAEAIAFDDAPINRCPPGGTATVAQLATLLQCEPIAVDESLGAINQRLVAQIREHECIGCAACLKVCPTDTIFGRNKMMHTVYEDDCSGCELCQNACPIDCIDFHEISQNDWPQNAHWPQWDIATSERWRTRYQHHCEHYPPSINTEKTPESTMLPKSDIREEIAAALVRARNKEQAS